MGSCTPYMGRKPIMVKKSDGGWRMLPSNPNGRGRRGQDNILRRRRSLLLSKDALRSKNARATYQRLVDKVFSEQVGRNIEAYVDDMVIKSTSEEEGPFLGHLITKKGIRANPQRKEVERKTDTKLEETKLSYEWKLYTDEASSSDGSRAGLMLINPEGKEYTYALRFKFDTIDNKSEYKALLTGLRIAQEMEIINLAIFVDYELLTNEVIKEIHKGSCSFNAKPRSMVVSITKQRYYWSSMHRDISRVVQDCKNCKEQSAVKKRAEIREIAARNAWPFSH
nr:reverse transcriptase domain-containing protein [Tanacetum cinerariifolium]